MKKLLILFFLVSCTSPNSNISSKNTKLNFDNDPSFEEFKLLVNEYAIKNPYPDIDK
tara:strand:+ start:642 stop:812 length:171 start_codon:yes stop_codon:yes gene_type:complete